MKAFEARDIRRSYNGRIVLDIPELSVEQGTCVALVGPNGSGKTTLLEILALLGRPDRGEVLINEKAVDFGRPETHRRKISFVAQEPYFFSGSLLRNMNFALAGDRLNGSDRTQRVGKYLSMLGILEFSNRSPRTFSSGEGKRAAIARTLCRETELVILDEPFTHIDGSSAAILEEVIGNLPDDRTVIFSTHELARAYRLADRIITLQDGRIFPWTLENMFRMTAYKVEDGFELRTGSGASIYYPGDLSDRCSYVVSLNPSEVFVSKDRIVSSVRNSYSGVITKIESSGKRTVHVSVECRKDFSVRAALTERSVRELGCNVGDTVWVHFKSTAMHVH